MDATPPTAPVGLVAEVGDGRKPPLFTWNAARDTLSGISRYELQLEGSEWVSAGPGLSLRLAAVLQDGSYSALVRAVDKAGNAGPTARVEFEIDTSPPRIASIGLDAPDGETVSLTWTTDEPSIAFVEYGLTENYGQSTAPGDSALSHAAEIGDLAPGETYHFRVRATDPAGNEGLSENRTFVVTADSRVEVQELTVSVSTVAPGEDVTVTATVTNIGNVSANYSFPLSVNGDAVDTAQGVLAVGESVEVSFVLVEEDDGTFEVEVGGLTGSFTVVTPVIVATADVSPTITPETAVATSAQGEPLRIVQGRVDVRRELDRITMVLPVVADKGVRVSGFLDSISGLSLSDDRLVIPVRNEDGRVAARIVAVVETAEGTGQTTEIKLGKMVL
ncbi:MAG: hypothetical protein O3A47_11380, partial [Chloroflexi bacterium]|nr:hypothetical protein [Chloroflexota bacterium]